MRRIIFALLLGFFLVSYTYSDVYARAGGGRSGGSYGSRGSRTYSAPTRPAAPSQGTSSGQYNQGQTAPPAPAPYRGGGFMRSLAGGMIGGIIGGLLFSSLGYGAGFGQGLFGSVGIFDILLIGLVIFLIMRVIKSRRVPEVDYGRPVNAYQADYGDTREIKAVPARVPEEKGLDDAFDEQRFEADALDIFFKVQAAWMHRDIDEVRHLLAPEISKLMTEDLSKMKKEGRINRLENIALREMNITEAWKEQGSEYITVKIQANALDYTTDEAGKIIEGNNTEPVLFSEYWTFGRSLMKPGWTLSAIQQQN